MYDEDQGARATGLNAWSQETTCKMAGNCSISSQTVYTNYAGEPMLSEFDDAADPANPALEGSLWDTFYAYDGQGGLSLTAEPSTQVSVNNSIPDLLDKQSDGTYRLMSASQGLIEGIDYYGSSDATPGYVKDTYVQHGQDATTKALQEYYQYASLTGSGVAIHPVSDDTVFSTATSNTSDTSGQDTHFDYQNDGLHVTKMTETLPAVDDENVSGTSDTIVTDYDSRGRVQDVTDADGYTTTYAYDDPTGTVDETAAVVCLSPEKTVTTTCVPDALGRPVVIIDGNGNMTTIDYSDGLLQSSVTTTPSAGPTQKVVTDLADGTVTSIATVPDGSMQAVSKTWLDYAGRTVETQQYDGQGHTYTTLDKYDDNGNLYWTEDATGTITKTDFDGLSRPTNVSTGADPSHLMLVQSNVYDDNGVGDGNLTQTTDYTNAATANHVTRSYYDWQDRLVAQGDGLQVTYSTLDNLGEITQSDVYDGRGAALTSSGGVPDPPAADLLRAETTYAFDARGRNCQTTVHSVGQSDGTVDGLPAETTSTVYDPAGNVHSTTDPLGRVTSYAYDGAGARRRKSILRSTTRPPRPG